MKKDTIVGIVIQFLKEIEVDGETMEYIVDEVGMSEQLLKQKLVRIKSEDVDGLANVVANDICANIIDEHNLQDYTLEFRFNEAFVSQFCLDFDAVETVVKECLLENLKSNG